MLSLMKMEVIDGVYLKQHAHSNFRLRIPIKNVCQLVLHVINDAIHIAFENWSKKWMHATFYSGFKPTH